MQSDIEKISADGTCKVSAGIYGEELLIKRSILIEDIWSAPRTRIIETDVTPPAGITICLNSTGRAVTVGACPQNDTNGILQESMLLVCEYAEGLSVSERTIPLGKIVEIIQISVSEDSSVIAIWMVTVDERHSVNVYNLVHGRYCLTLEVAPYHYPDTELALNDTGDVLTIPVKDADGLICYVGYCYKDARWNDIDKEELL